MTHYFLLYDPLDNTYWYGLFNQIDKELSTGWQNSVNAAITAEKWSNISSTNSYKELLTEMQDSPYFEVIVDQTFPISQKTNPELFV